MRRLGTTTRIAVRALAANPLRAILTTLGVIIGVAAVITTISIGAGARQSVQNQLSTLGTNLLTVSPGRVTSPFGVGQGAGTIETLTLDDAEAIAEAFPEIEGVTAEFSRSARVVAGSENDTVSVSGVTPSYPLVRNWKPIEGEFFGEQDMRQRARVALIGTTVRDNLFPDGDAVGQVIRINGVPFTIIGIMESKGATGFADRDDVVFVPLSTAQKRLFGVKHVRAILVKARRPEQMAGLMTQIEDLLRIEHRLRDDAENDFTVQNQADLVQALQGTTQTITVLLSSIAAVSLLVGGIGIMNIMLVSVTERIREIGIRKALGARRQDILLQFLVEAVILSLGGGLLGIFLAVGGTSLLSTLAGWATIITPQSIVMAFGFAAAVGVFFGLYPAQRASALDPIIALRSE